MGKSTCVLVIEDDPDLGLLIVDILEAYPEVAASLARHPSAIPANATPDIVVTDLFGSAWYDRSVATRELGALRNRFPDVPIILVTAHWQAVADRPLLPVDAMMAKPFDVDALAQLVLSFDMRRALVGVRSPTEA